MSKYELIFASGRHSPLGPVSRSASLGRGPGSKSSDSCTFLRSTRSPICSCFPHFLVEFPRPVHFCGCHPVRIFILSHMYPPNCASELYPRTQESSNTSRPPRAEPLPCRASPRAAHTTRPHVRVTVLPEAVAVPRARSSLPAWRQSLQLGCAHPIRDVLAPMVLPFFPRPTFWSSAVGS